MLEMLQLPFMIQALLACLLLSVILSYFGVHVVRRGIVFIDLALAQISSAGVGFALLIDGDPRVYGLGFTLVGSLVMAFLPKTSRVPQEAMIGIIYAVASASAILMLSKTAHGDADVTSILFGNILSVTTTQLVEMLLVFGLVGLVHAIFYRKFTQLLPVTLQNSDQKFSTRNVWNMLFYLSLAIIIADAIRAAGVLLVFSYLIVPAVSALLFFKRTIPVMLVALVLGILTSFMGLYSSYAYDLPTGAAIVACFGVVFVFAILARVALPDRE